MMLVRDNYRRAIGALVIGVFLASGCSPVAERLENAGAECSARAGDRQTERNCEDLAVLGAFLKFDNSFSRDEQRAFEVSLTTALANPPSTLAGLEVEVARAVAISQNGHTNSRSAPVGQGLPALPIRLGWFREGLFIVAAGPRYRDVLGANVLAIEGKTPEEMVGELATYIGGSAQLERLLALNLIVQPAFLHAAGLAAAPHNIRVDLALGTGEEVTRLIDAGEGSIATTEEDYWPTRSLYPDRPPTDHRTWLHVLDPVSPPLYLQKADQNYWRTALSDGGVYVRVARVRDQEPVRIERFFADTIAEVRQSNPSYAVVDLRGNSGGDYTKAVNFTKELPAAERPSGTIYVITDAGTFSAALVMAARLKYFSDGRAEIVGELVGDDLISWGEVSDTTLPNSEIRVMFATKYHNWRDGCGLSDVFRCFALNWLYGVPAGDLTPDRSITPSFAAYASGRDDVLEHVQELAGQRP